MSILPSPNENVTWRDYHIATPTFDLTPVEKPDMSPFLVHMTGKGQLQDILSGNNSPAISAGTGFLKAATPEQSSGTYDAPIVCFSESPTFALDFFRYRSFPRWKADQRFGIGFKKGSMVDRGVRPVIYLDDRTTKAVVSLHKSFESNPGVSDREQQACSVVASLFPLIFPMLEGDRRQGFMWEREWRYPSADGLIFSHSDISLICCPIEEEAQIRKLLGTTAAGIQFVRTWQEYSDVTEFLRRQQPVWARQKMVTEAVRDASLKIHAKTGLVKNLQVALHSLESYESLANRLSAESERIASEKKLIVAELEKAQAELKELESRKPNDENYSDFGLKS